MSAIVSPIREPLIRGSKTYHQITEDLCAATERAPSMAGGVSGPQADHAAQESFRARADQTAARLSGNEHGLRP